MDIVNGPTSTQEQPVALDGAAEACPACGSPESSILFEAGDRLYHTTDRVFQILQCEGCRLVRLHPPPSPSELRSYYPEGYWEAAETTFADRLEQSYRRLVLRDTVQFVKRSIEESEEQGIVLDVGCGGGLFLEALLSQVNRKAAGLDFSLDAAAATWENGVPAVCATLSRAPFAPESCAVITMFRVLEHLYDPASYLDAAHELLAPHGRLIVQASNAQSWQFLLFGERWSELDVPRHLLHFRLRDLEMLLADCGFEVLRVRHFSWRANPAGLARTIAPSLDPTVRRLRRVKESPGQRLLKDAMFLALIAISVPLTMVEAACRAGGSVMIEARKKSS